MPRWIVIEECHQDAEDRPTVLACQSYRTREEAAGAASKANQGPVRVEGSHTEGTYRAVSAAEAARLIRADEARIAALDD